MTCQSETNLKRETLSVLPRLPLEGRLDLTYRCNNDCRHCWLRIPADAKEKENELSFDQIRRIVDEARMMGCRHWSISGGEPMLRPDFPEIFDYITRVSGCYSINTNGTLISPKTARLFRRRGVKMVALYGATKDVHDQITRNPGSFEATLRGFAYLKEAGAVFTVQLIPLKDNYHQFQEMVSLGKSLSKHYRVGAAWLYLSDCADQKRNAEIKRQRLSPKEVVELDKPDLSYEESIRGRISPPEKIANGNYLFSACVNNRRDFHIDSYGQMTFCCFIKDPSFRYDLRNGSFQDGWDNFIPSLATKVKATKEYKNNCGSCDLRKDCRFCPVYGYLEQRNFNAKVNYLCAVAKENRRFKQNWRKNHRRYFKIAGIVIQVESDLPITDRTFHPKFKHFRVKGPGKDTVSIRHHFGLPDLENKDLGQEFYRQRPWAIYKNNGSWIYLGIYPKRNDKRLNRIAIFNSNHNHARIFNDNLGEKNFLKGNLLALTLFASDQIFIARILADRQGLYLHSCGVNLKGRGLLFIGHSGAGKSTMAKILKGKAEILCDDRIIVRNTQDGFKIYGTWSHGEVPEVSAGSAPLRKILFLEKAKVNQAILMTDKQEITKRLLACLVKPLVTRDWWEKTLSSVDKIVQAIPCYVLKFDKNKKIVELLKQL
jgi:MoaA/NifB/PqqE/SkfB family radical SAM enzyme